MARDIWAETEVEITGEYEINSSSPIPKGTICRATIETVEWHSYSGSTHKNPNITWVIDEPEEYSGRKVFQTPKINGEDPKSQYYKPEKNEDTIKVADITFRNIDKNAGGFVYALKREPTDDELKKYLVGAAMLLTLGVNSYNNKNFVIKVSPAPDAPVKATPKPKDNGFEDTDIPF